MTIRLDSIANIAVAVMCIVVTYAVATRFVLPKFSGAAAATGYRPGDQLTRSVQDLDLERSNLSAFVVVSSSCTYCRDSVKFYRQLLDLAHQEAPGALQVLFLGIRDIQDATAFVTMNDLRPVTVKTIPADVRARIPGTPTLLVVDSAGRVKGSWSGRLTSAEEAEVLSALMSRPAGRL